MVKDIIVFALSSSKDLAQEIVDYLGIPMGDISVRHFADGEILIEPGETVRGKHVFIVQSTCGPVSENLMEILVCLDACKRASAGEITVVMPYYGYARQDRKARARQPITAKLVADLLQTAGANRVVTIDLHATQIQGFFNVPSDDLSAVSLIGQYFRHKNLEDIVVVSPDHGGAVRARKLADCLGGAPVAIVDKRRTAPNVAEAMNLIGDVQGKTAIVIDDIVDTGGSLMGGVRMLAEKGAKEVYCACTHGVLSNNAIQRINDSPVKEFVITNSIPLGNKANDNTANKVVVLSVGFMLAKVIEAITNNEPVSIVYDLFNKE